MATKPKSKRKTSKPKAKPRKAPVRRVNNQNTVRVHVINSVGGGGAQPPPYTGPDRGLSIFTPYFHVPEKEQKRVPMSSGVSLSSTPIMSKEIDTQTDPIMMEPEEVVKPPISQLKDDGKKSLDAMKKKELLDLARAYKVKNYSRKEKTQLIKDIRAKGHPS